jgi:DNA adenine methylase
MVGGRAQDGEWSLDARFDKSVMIQRLEALHTHARRISVDHLDAVEFLSERAGRSTKRTFAYLDPPYFVKGRDLYLNRLTRGDHAALASFVKEKLWTFVVVGLHHLPAGRESPAVARPRGLPIDQVQEIGPKLEAMDAILRSVKRASGATSSCSTIRFWVR